MHSAGLAWNGAREGGRGVSGARGQVGRGVGQRERGVGQGEPLRPRVRRPRSTAGRGRGREPGRVCRGPARAGEGAREACLF